MTIRPRGRARLPGMNNNESRVYEYYRFRPPTSGNRYRHLTMLPIDSDVVVLPQQGNNYPSKCILCSFGYLCSTLQLARQHYRQKHHHHALYLEGTKILSCKCSEVRYTGKDNHRRNAHWHCGYCYKPVKDRKVLATHLVQVHSVDLQVVEELNDVDYRYW